MLNSYIAGMVGVPVVFLSGDAGLCQEAQSFLPGLATAPVMRGIGGSTVSIHPEVAVEHIRAGVTAALQGDLSRGLVRLPVHFSVGVRCREHAKDYAAGFFPGAALKEPHVVTLEADDYFDVLWFFFFAI